MFDNDGGSTNVGEERGGYYTNCTQYYSDLL